MTTVATNGTTTNGNGTRANGTGPPSKWATVTGATKGSSAYSVDKFYVSASDIRGHRSYIRLAIPPDLAREIETLVQSGAFPAYEVTSDFVRDAIHHHLVTRQSQINDPSVREAQEELFVRRQVRERSENMRRASEFWASQRQEFEQTFGNFLRDGAYGQLFHVLLDAEKMADPAPEPYRSSLMTMIGEWRQKVPARYKKQAPSSGAVAVATEQHQHD
jgi:Arc/MetJ-type ribon-helix-helix transcriptional regulator